MVSVMKLEKAPTESYADIGGLDKQVQEIKEAVDEMKLIRAGKKKARNAEDFLNEL